MPDNERILRQTLQVRIDKQSAAEAEDRARAMAAELKKVLSTSQQARDAFKQYSQAARSFKEISDRAAETRQRMNQLRESTERLNTITGTIAGIGAAITGPLTLAANSYVQKIGAAEETSRAWLASTNKLEQAQTRVGRVAAQAIVPYMEQAANLASKAAAFAEKHPDLISAAINVGMVAATLGAVGMAVSRGIRIYADMKTIAAAATQESAAVLMNNAADKMLAAAGMKSGVTGAGGTMGVGGLAGGAIGIGAVGAAIGEGALYSNLVRPGIAEKAGENVAKIVDTLVFVGSAGFVDPAKIDQITGKLTDFAKSIGLVGESAESAAPTGSNGAGAVIDQAGVMKYISYLQQEEQAKEQYEDQQLKLVEQYEKARTKAKEQYEKQQTDLVEEYEKQRAQALENYQFQLDRQQRDFREQERKAEEDYYRQRQELARNFGRETLRMEQDHQKQMRRMREDHEARLDDLAASRDALGIVNEMRSYERERQRAEEDYSEQMKRRKEDYALQLAEMEENFKRQREERMKDYEQRLADQEEDFKRQQEQAEEQFEEQKEKLKEQFDEMEAERLKALQDEKETMRKEFEKQKAARKEALIADYNLQKAMAGDTSAMLEDWWKDMYAGWEEFLGEVKSATEELPGFNAPNSSGSPDERDESKTGGGRAVGGYVSSCGRYLLAEQGEEYVLNNSTVKALERMMGGKITQGGLVGTVNDALKMYGVSRRSVNEQAEQIVRSQARRNGYAEAMINMPAGRSSQTMNLHQNFTFSGSFSEGDKIWFRQTAREQAYAALNDVTQGLDESYAL